MNKEEIMTRLLDCGVFAVIRGESYEKGYALAKACAKGGIVGLEVTYTNPSATAIIEALSKENGDWIVGAGTVLEPTTARLAILAGAKFIVAPTFDEEVAKMCNLYHIPYFPGVFTPNEILAALKAGADICKIFPGSAAGPSYIKAIHGPFPQVPCMPSGGVDLNNVTDWIKAGAVAVGAGSNLSAPAATGDFEKVTELAKEYVRKVQEARKSK